MSRQLWHSKFILNGWFVAIHGAEGHGWRSIATKKLKVVLNLLLWMTSFGNYPFNISSYTQRCRGFWGQQLLLILLITPLPKNLPPPFKKISGYALTYPHKLYLPKILNDLVTSFTNNPPQLFQLIKHE